MTDKPQPESEDQPKVKVDDRRRFHSNGTPRPPDPSQREEASTPDDAAETAAERPPCDDSGPGFTRVGEAKGPEGSHAIDFSAFVLSLGQAALINLGAAPHPDTGKVSKNLQHARETIDILGMLQQKTRGNLTTEECRLLDGLLYQLRLTFVEAKTSS